MKVPKARKLESGNYFIQLRLGGESIPITATDERDCVRQATLAKAEYLTGKRESNPEQKPARLPTLGEAIDDYIARRSNILSPATIRGYMGIRRNRFKDTIDQSLSDIKDSEWAIICNKEATICGPKTLTNSWRFVASVLRSATGKEPPKVMLPQIPPNETPFLEPEQIKLFVSLIKDTGTAIPALLALSSLRSSEISALRWENVDLDKKLIAVKGAAVFGPDHKLVQKKQTKNKTSTRHVPIMMDELYTALKNAQQQSGLVETRHPCTTRDNINRLCAKHGLPKVGLHGLRHSFASLSYHLGVPEKVSMEIGGWSDDKTMRKIYTHVARSDIKTYGTLLMKFYDNANENANE